MTDLAPLLEQEPASSSIDILCDRRRPLLDHRPHLVGSQSLSSERRVTSGENLDAEAESPPA